MSTQPLLDLSNAQVFADEPAQLRELVASFEQSLAQEMAVIEAGIQANDATQVEHALHALKGFMSLFACADLAQSITNLYQQSRQQPLEVTSASFTSLVPSLQALLAEVRAWLGAL
jgi:HPt (histidine-containing phosphotransfer) domain-containing protein